MSNSLRVALVAGFLFILNVTGKDIVQEGSCKAELIFAHIVSTKKHCTLILIVLFITRGIENCCLFPHSIRFVVTAIEILLARIRMIHGNRKSIGLVDMVN